MNVILKFIGTAILKKVALSAVEVLVERTDNDWDDAILNKMKEKEVI